MIGYIFTIVKVYNKIKLNTCKSVNIEVQASLNNYHIYQSASFDPLPAPAAQLSAWAVYIYTATPPP
jgi:hypothetical protein